MSLNEFLGIELVDGDTRDQCISALMVAGEFFQCDLAEEHDGWAHMNKKAEAIWQ